LQSDFFYLNESGTPQRHDHNLPGSAHHSHVGHNRHVPFQRVLQQLSRVRAARSHLPGAGVLPGGHCADARLCAAHGQEAQEQEWQQRWR